MSSTSSHHHELTNGVGKCSVPMWEYPGVPAGFCDKPAYGKRPGGTQWRDAYTGELKRLDGKFNGYIPGLACQVHGGPAPRHFGDPCVHCGISQDDVPVGACIPR